MLPRAVEIEIDEACTEFVMAVEYDFYREQLMDTKYFQQALQEFGQQQTTNRSLGDLKIAELSHILRRAQELKDVASAREVLQGKPQPIIAALDAQHELKDADGKPQPVAHLLDHAEVIR